MPPRIIFILGLVVLTLSAFAAPKEKPVPPPPLTYSTPSAAAPNKTTRITLQGPIAGQPIALWTSFPAEVTRPNPADKSATFDLKLPPDVPAGIHAIRLITTTGQSNLQLFMVDDLPTTIQATTSHPQHLPLPGAIDGACTALAADYYRIDVKKGQRVAFDVVAQRLASRLDPILRIIDSAGREVAYCDDTPGLGADIRFAHTFAADGQYLIELRDTEYQGGSEFRYRLRAGNFPTATVPFPLGAKRGTTKSFDFASPDASPVITQKITLGIADRMNFALKDEASDSFGFVSILAADADDFIAPAPHHTFQSAARIPLAVNISGRFQTPGAQDFYEIAAKKGDKLAIRAHTRSVNSPCDLLLQFFKPDGQKMLESKAVAADEGTLDVTIPADGAYRLCAQDLSGGAGPAYVYRLEVNRVTPGFALTVDNDKYEAPAAGTVRIKVKCVRRDFDEPITLSLSGDPATYEFKNQIIPAGKSETDLEVKLPPDARANQPITFTILGTANISNTPHIEIASTSAIIKSLYPRLAIPLPDLDGLLSLIIRPAK